MVELTRRLPRARRRRERGFTLIEVTVALAVLAVGLLAVSAAQIHAMRGASSGRHTSDAAELAQREIEELQRLEWTHADLASTGGAWTTRTPGETTTQIDTAIGTVNEQAYQVDTRITDVVSPTGVFLKTIDVRVQWNEPNRPNRSYTITTMRHNDVRS
jgi:prepilin-type N-terminal cleavage/methylation domain-containing protein